MARSLDPRFSSADAWIFLALTFADVEAGTLPHILWLADALNRAIPTAAELDGALNRLLAAGLIAQQGRAFYVPPGVRRRFQAARRRRKRERFETAGWFVRSAGPLAEVRRRVTVSAAEHRQAYETYRHQFEEALRQVTGGRAAGGRTRRRPGRQEETA